MLLYVFLAMVVISSIITGIIVTIMDKKGLFPKEEVRVKKKHNSKKSTHTIDRDEVTMNTGILIPSENDDSEEYYSIPVIVSSYTVDLSNVVGDIQRMSDMNKNNTTIPVKEEKVL